MSTGEDFQSKSILEGLTQLENILDRPLAEKALDLQELAQTTEKKDLLTRLRKSLVQYVERSGALVYVAFIGHYSSGKSSTINSLLNISDTKLKRAVGLNPTDTFITLLTRGP